MKCAGNILKDPTEENALHVKKCNCLPDCNYVDYDLEIVQEKLISSNQKYIASNISVSIYFADEEFIGYKRSESYGTVSLLSNIGGILGLFLGVSMLSIVEALYFVSLRVSSDLWSKLISLRTKA